MRLPRPTPPAVRHPLARLAPVLLAASLPGLLLSAPRAGAQSPELVALDSTVTTNDDLRWTINFHLRNPLAVGLYPDSFYCDVEDLDPGETHAPRTSRQFLQFMLPLIPPVSAGDEGFFQYDGLAPAEKAILTFRLPAHDAAGKRYALAARVEAVPGPLAERCPSRLLAVDGRKVEVVLVPPQRGAVGESAPGDSARGPAPGVLLIHGQGSDARKMLRPALMLAHRGFAVALVSQPGYGLSEGPPDFMGPATVRAAQAALEFLAKAPGVDPQRLGVWGVSRGATVAMELASRCSDIGAVVAQSGIYDLWAAWRGTTLPALRDDIVAQAGRDSSAWRERSPALEPAARVRAAVLFLHGETDPLAPVAQARTWQAALEAAGVRVQAKFYPNGGQVLPLGDTFALASTFFAKELHP